MHEYITGSLHSIFNHRKDIVYRRSSSILISVIRIYYRKITLCECPFNIHRRLGLEVAYVTVLVKVSGSSLGKLFFILDFFNLNKKQTRRAQENDIIFMCVTKSVKPPFLDRDDGIRQQPPSQFQKQTNCLFCIKLLSENQKKPFGLRTWKRQLNQRVLLELPLLSRIRREKSERGRFHPRRGRRGSHIITLSPSTRQHSDITRFYTVRKHLPALNTLNSALVGDLSFPGSVEALRKRFGLLVYCWK